MKSQFPVKFILFILMALLIGLRCNSCSEGKRSEQNVSVSDKKEESAAGHNYVNEILERVDKIEIYFPRSSHLVFEREEITPQYTITPEEEVKRIISFMKEETEYVIAIGKLPVAEIAKSGRMFLSVKNKVGMTIDFYRDNAYLRVDTGILGDVKFKEGDILVSPRKINADGEKYLKNLLERLK